MFFRVVADSGCKSGKSGKGCKDGKCGKCGIGGKYVVKYVIKCVTKTSNQIIVNCELLKGGYFMKSKRITAMLITIMFMLSAASFAYASTSGTWSTVTMEGDKMSIHMVQGDFAANLEVSHVTGYEFIDNTASVAEYYDPIFYDDGFIMMEFANTHFITVRNEAALTFVDYEYSNTEENNLRFYEFANPVISGYDPVKYETLYPIPMRPGWTFEFADNTVKMSEAFVLYNRATDGSKAEAFIFHIIDKRPDDIPPIFRKPRTANGVQGVIENYVGRAPVQDYYGEIGLNGGMSFEVPKTEYVYHDEHEFTYSLFITENGTIDIDFWVQYEGDAAGFAASRDVIFYDYAPVISGADVTFEIVNIKHLVEEPFIYRAPVSGFFFSAGTSASKSGDEIFAEYLVGLVLSEAQVEEYRATGAIAEYPGFDWSVLGGTGDNTDPQTEPQPELQPEAQPESQPNVYIVQNGDYLIRIADMFNTTWQELQRLNNIKDPNLIYTGQVIKLP